MSRHYSPATTSSQQSNLPFETSSENNSLQTQSSFQDPQRFRRLVAPSRSPSPYMSPYAPLPQTSAGLPSVPVLRSQNSPSPRSFSSVRSSSETSRAASTSQSIARSTYSSASRDDMLYSSSRLTPSGSSSSLTISNGKKLGHVSNAPFSVQTS